jgi:hypothetical protein
MLIKNGYTDSPSYQVYWVFVRMHPFYMLLEVVKTGPDFVLVFTVLSYALIRLLSQTDRMDALLVSSKIIGCSET